MPLQPGSRLGPYEILAPLGAGGMGEVHRGRHMKLGREVAIKVLPASVADEPDRPARFEREARTASALNHPNIVTIYDIATDDGVTCIAMELVEGRTVRDRIEAGPLDVGEVLGLATQIADGVRRHSIRPRSPAHALPTLRHGYRHLWASSPSEQRSATVAPAPAHPPTARTPSLEEIS